MPILSLYNFLIIDLDNLSVIEQIEIFYSADFVIGIHGAGLTNILFCRQNVKILEIFNKTYLDPSYRVLATALNLSYNYYIADNIKPSANPQQSDIFIEKNIFNNILSRFVK